MDNQEIEIELYEEPQEIEIGNSEVVYDRNIIESISVNGVEQLVDENKNVDITVPTKLSDLTNDNNTVQDSNYVHTDNNYTNEEKSKLASLENYDDTEIKADILDLQTNKADITDIPTELADLNDDSTHRLVTDTEKSTWDNKSDFSGSYNDLTNKPSIPSKTSDLTNDSGFIDKTVNDLTYYTLKTNTGSLIDLEINQSTYVVTLSLKDQDGNVISTDNIDLPLESVVVNGSFDSVNKKIILTLENGNTVDIPVGDLIAGLQTEITSQNKLASDLVDDSNSGNKFVTTSEKSTWNAKYDKPVGRNTRYRPIKWSANKFGKGRYSYTK